MNYKFEIRNLFFFYFIVFTMSTGSFRQESCELNKLKVNELKKHRTLSEVKLSYAKQNQTTFMQVKYATFLIVFQFRLPNALNGNYRNFY